MVLAQEEARLLNHNFIGTEHLLLGLLDEGEGVAATALEGLGISADAVRAKVEETMGAPSTAAGGSPPFTPRAKKVLELGLREALQLGHNYIGTEHILLGLLREGEGVGACVLVDLGADLLTVRRRVLDLLSGPGGEAEGRDVIGRMEPADLQVGAGRRPSSLPSGSPPDCHTAARHSSPRLARAAWRSPPSRAANPGRSRSSTARSAVGASGSCPN